VDQRESEAFLYWMLQKDPIRKSIEAAKPGKLLTAFGDNMYALLTKVRAKKGASLSRLVSGPPSGFFIQWTTSSFTPWLTKALSVACAWSL